MGCAGSKAAAQQPRGSSRPVVTRPGAQPAAQSSATAVAAAAAAAASPPPRVKLVLLGDSGVGKSCLALRYVKGQFDPASKITVGAAFLAHNVSLPDGKTIKFEIWDTAGQERYLSLAPLYYRGAHAAAIVFDLTSPDTLEKARYWVGELKKNASASTVLILVGNKADLAEQRAVGEEEARAWADSERMLYVETSAKTAANVAEMFEAVAARLVGGGGGGGLPLSSHAASS